MDLGVVLTVLLGLFFLAWGIFYKKIDYVTRKGAWKVVKIVVLGLLSLELVFVGGIAIYGQIDNVSYEEDAVIVLGRGGPWRASDPAFEAAGLTKQLNIIRKILRRSSL